MATLMIFQRKDITTLTVTYMSHGKSSDVLMPGLGGGQWGRGKKYIEPKQLA